VARAIHQLAGPFRRPPRRDAPCLVVGVVYFLFCAGLSSAVARLERQAGAAPTAGAAARREALD